MSIYEKLSQQINTPYQEPSSTVSVQGFLNFKSPEMSAADPKIVGHVNQWVTQQGMEIFVGKFITQGINCTHEALLKMISVNPRTFSQIYIARIHFMGINSGYTLRKLRQPFAHVTMLNVLIGTED